jgi:hypothetical protein
MKSLTRSVPTRFVFRIPFRAPVGACVLCLAMSLAAAAPAPAQVNSAGTGINLNAILDTRLTVIATPGLVNFALPPNGFSIGNTPVTVQTIRQLPQFFGIVRTYAYFTSTTAALTNGSGANIPSASVAASINGGAFTAFTGNSPFAAGSSIQIRQTIIFIFNRNGTTTDTVNLRINTTGLGLVPGTYTGVLNFQAVVL